MARANIKPIPALSQKDTDRFWSKVNKAPGQGPQGDCWQWTGTLINGYADFRMPSAHFHASRIAYFLATGEDPGDLWACHTCDNPLCVRDEHLFKGTPRDNTHDSMRKGRRGPTGVTIGGRHPCETNGNARLTPEQVAEIRRRYIPRVVSQRSLAVEFGVHQTMIGFIVRHANWRIG